MLLSEKMKQTDFSNAESALVEYILAKGTAIEPLTIKEIAEANYVHPSTLIRVAKKLGYKGWLELREEFLAEQTYLQTYFEDVDANFPFQTNDGLMTIANKIASLERTTIDDTLSLLNHDELQKAKQIMLEAQQIKMFGNNANLLISQDFALKMRRIKKNVVMSQTMGETAYEAFNSQAGTCAILISYTGENTSILQIANILQKQNIPIIALTSIGDNTLASLSQAVLRMTTRERLYSKIANFTINSSICYLLDVLYSCIFAENYQANLNHLIKVSELVDKRKTSSAIMAESPESLIQFTESFRPN
ncbi:MurR/RpiR family transcriptional regulator [Enterococcus raffinosus]|uniref:MurR/RpiR family transcriptional regulator n=1 Tax=Enterococcus raffinosus TaxID=71452 RepID=A0AAW8T7C6_9ENTE|nr:MurR/RpiR family transcriptional regulator [Enterococcus raffinosus]MDT2521959.1 MurR/RpiR family transcriptional regulator [Enterococcus raffinosus]MDT2528304.1 MurR/RpiR family transcriptional regulator [Enterococcus raffinosus]MDT2533231.1 MurR/RpiR family transcriptional regulator [Enterococcus raffinosus]MDT2543671.1 MurR/RpiR family transcriptional regulator [Enterococcus raffinosus]MDT2553785.1 MurR/RpiR family transcriptional regulator [Enterococcus raffinosus]